MDVAALRNYRSSSWINFSDNNRVMLDFYILDSLDIMTSNDILTKIDNLYYFPKR